MKKKETRRNMFRQRSSGRSWGVFVQIAQQVSIPVSMISLFLVAITAYKTTLVEWLWERGVHLGVGEFMGIIAGLLLVASFIVWKFLLSSFYSVFNEQFYRHDNPLRRDIREVKDLMVGKFEELEKRVEKLEKKGRR